MTRLRASTFVVLAGSVAGAGLLSCSSILGSFDEVETPGDGSVDGGDGGDVVVEEDHKLADAEAAPTESGVVDSTIEEANGSDTCGATCDSSACCDDGGCPVEHHDNLAGPNASDATYFDCLPAGVPGDPSTYSQALLEIGIGHLQAHSEGATYGAWSAISCGANLCECAMITGSNGAMGATVLCYGGEFAGSGATYAGTSCICPSTWDTLGKWW